MSATTDRAERLAERATEEGLDALIVGDLVCPGDSTSAAMANLRWLCGFGGTSGIGIIGPQVRVFITDFRYEVRAAGEVDPSFDRVISSGELVATLAERVAAAGGRVGFDDSLTSVRIHERLAERAGEGVELVAARGLPEHFRRIKDAGEVDRIAAASALTDELFSWIPERGLAGSSERQVAIALEARMREAGAEPAFPSIVAAGPNGAQPHADPSDRVIGPGEMVVVDMGAELDGYCSDGTRTFWSGSGEPGAREREIYDLVLAAQLAALDVIRPGAEGVAADAASRVPIEAAGHGDHYGHGLGHGVGIEVHEAPRLSRRSTDTLEAGDVVTVEPGIYLPGEFGVRIEDLVVVTDDGVRNLSSTPKGELIAVG